MKKYFALPTLVCEIKLSLLKRERHSRGFGHNFDVNALVGLDSDD